MQKHTLRAKAHHLKPVILFGAKGLTEALLQEIDIALNAHELIKMKLTGQEKEDRQHVLTEICEKLGAEPIQLIGNIAVIYRKKKD